MKPTKACAVVVREIAGKLMVLAFRHPTAGCQLVKGSIENGETADVAAERELKEEAGVVASVISDLGLWQSQHEGPLWSFHLCRPAEVLPDTWTHWCDDDGGHEFQFFWQPLDADSLLEWHPVHARALGFIKDALKGWIADGVVI